MKLYISDVQRFSVGDGDGIRTTVFFKGCSLLCPWCHNPEAMTARAVTLRYESGKTKVSGRIATPEELLPELLEDVPFYCDSGGGVTLSGGEVLLQAEGATELSRLLREQGVSVLVDTAGCVPSSAFDAVDPYVDGYLYDYKTADAEKYRFIGGDIATVEENLARVLRGGRDVHVRIPLIPGFNTDASSVSLICERLKALGVAAVELLPFHRLGSAKYKAMGLDYAYADTEPLTASEKRKIVTAYSECFKVKTE